MTRVPVIIDTDPGVDDVIAILLAIASPELEILAYSVSFGNADVESSYTNILKVYRTIALHLEQFPMDKHRFPNFDPTKRPILAKGSHGPLQGELHSAQYFHGRDGLGEITERHPELSLPGQLAAHPFLQLTDRSGVDVALDILRQQPSRSVSYIALGPLTSLALMMRQDSKLVTERIGRIICMGGALNVPGNVSPVAEFNFFADPFAVKELLILSDVHGGLPKNRFLMLPLDITTPHEIPFPLYRDIVDPSFEGPIKPSIPSTKSPMTHFTSSFLEKTREMMLLFGKDAMELHDIVAVWCAIANPPFGESEQVVLASGWKACNCVFEIERTGELTRGMLVVDRREDESAYPLGANRSEAREHSSDLAYQSLESQNLSGTWCITQTPGPAVLLEMLFSRIWGCSL